MICQRFLSSLNYHLRRHPSSLVHQVKMLTSTQKMDDDVLFEKRGIAGVITLNRPKALNTLNLSMLKKILPRLKEWNSQVSFVLIKGSGEKAFCAGGDIKALTVVGQKKDPSALELFFIEYNCNYAIGTMAIPYIALIHGFTMGGGVGLSVHGKYRVATEKTVFAMPETAIGLFPDVGGSYFLPRLPNYLGTYYGLTGHRLNGVDVLKGGIATHFCSSNHLPSLEQELLSISNANQIESILVKYTKESLQEQDFSLNPRLNQIKNCFSADTIEEILQRLQTDNSTWANEQVENLMKMSPTSLKLTLRLIRKGAELSFAECFEMEFRVVARILEQKDFYEGVRALLVDRDKKPNWSPSTLKEVTDDMIESYFAAFPSSKQGLVLSKL